MIPRVKQYKKGEGSFSVSLVFPATEDGAAARLILSHFLPAVPTEVGECATVSLSPLTAAGRGEYTLGVFPDGIAIARPPVPCRSPSPSSHSPTRDGNSHKRIADNRTPPDLCRRWRLDGQRGLSKRGSGIHGQPGSPASWRRSSRNRTHPLPGERPSQCGKAT